MPLSGNSNRPVLVYFASVGKGGLANYAEHQARALADAGASIVFLGSGHFEDSARLNSPNIEFIRLSDAPRWIRQCGILGRVTASILERLMSVRQLVSLVRQRKIQSVLLTAYAEYWAPLWSWQLQRLHRKNVWFGVVVHDPVRDFRIGPVFWHRWSMSLAYSFVDVAFVHDSTDLDTGSPRRNLSVVKIPHGIYEFPYPSSPPSLEQVLTEFGLPLNSIVLLSFGHIRDGKNLDLTIRALVHQPRMYLLVAGKEQSSGQRTVAYYQQLARDVGVAERCVWRSEFITEECIWKYFFVANAVMLTYSKAFHSASGVLNVAAVYENSLIASGGDGPLKSAVQQYGLGIWCEPDSESSLYSALKSFLEAPLTVAKWANYKHDNSWQTNANVVLASIEQFKSPQALVAHPTREKPDTYSCAAP